MMQIDFSEWGRPATQTVPGVTMRFGVLYSGMMVHPTPRLVRVEVSNGDCPAREGIASKSGDKTGIEELPQTTYPARAFQGLSSQQWPIFGLAPSTES